MQEKKIYNFGMKDVKDEKILLLLLPFWTPLIPPLSISRLKTYINKHGGYKVKTVNSNTQPELREFNVRYFRKLAEYIPIEKRGNFYNIGNEMLERHMMIHINHSDIEQYKRLTIDIIYKSYYVELNDEQITALNNILFEYFDCLKKFFLCLIEEVKPTILGISVYIHTLASSIFCFKLTKKHFPDIPTIMGGAIFSESLAKGALDLEYFFKVTEDYIDKIIVGQGEILFLKLLKGELPGDKRIFDRNDANKFIDFSDAGTPDLSDFNLQYYPYLPTFGSVGCSNKCSFCNVNFYYGDYRQRNSKQILEEMRIYYKNYNFQLFLMMDSMVNGYINEFSDELLKHDDVYYWDSYIKVDKDNFTAENALKWRRAGYYRSRLGLESGSQRVLDIMRKEITVDQIKNAIRCLASAGIKTTGYFVIGHPEETEEDFQQTMDLVTELKNDFWQVECNPYYFFATGQTDSVKWTSKYKFKLLYKEEASPLLVIRAWTLDCYPGREETYQRVSKFVTHCNELGIPNPYSFEQLNKADLRWQKLHKNAVPSILLFKDKDLYINECKNVKLYSKAQETIADDGDFGF